MAERRSSKPELSEAAKDNLPVEKGLGSGDGGTTAAPGDPALIEDPLADFVLRSQVPSGSTVLVEPGEADTDDEDVKLSVIEPAPAPTPVGVGAEGGADAEPAGDAVPEADAPEPPVAVRVALTRILPFAPAGALWLRAGVRVGRCACVRLRTGL